MPTTPADIANRLWRSLNDRAPIVAKRRRWLDGRALAAPDAQNIYERHIATKFAAITGGNFLPQVVACYADRLRIDSVRNAFTARHDGQTWAVMTAAKARKDIHTAMVDALGIGWGYLLILPHARETGRATTRPIAPEFAVTEPWEDDPSEARYGLTISASADNTYTARLYTPSEVFTFVSPQGYSLGASTDLAHWGTGGHALHGLGRMPLVPLGSGDSLIAAGVTHQERANQSLLHGLAIERAQSFRKYFAIGYELEYDADGNPKDPGITLDPSTIGWLPPNSDGSTASMWESSTTSGRDTEASAQHALNLLAAACAVPPHYLYPTAAASVSADVLRLSESVFRARLAVLAEEFGETLDTALLLLRAAAGLPPADVSVVWNLTLPQDASLAGDTVIKLTQSGMSLDKALVRAGVATPAEAETIASAAGSNELAAFLTASTATPSQVAS